MWHYKLVNSNCIQRAVTNFNWEKVILFNETVLNIIRNFIPHKTVTFYDKDPLWIASRMK